MTDKQRAVLISLYPLITTILFGFFLYVSREFVSTVRAEQVSHTEQIQGLQTALREKSVELTYIKDALRRIENKLDGIVK